MTSQTPSHDTRENGRRYFGVIFVLGAPGAGKGTLCAHLAAKHNLAHYSVGDHLRTWMKANPLTTLAETIQHKLANQGFLDSTELSPFISQAIEDAMESQKNLNGVLIDGFPRCVEQSQTYHSWPFQEKLPLVGRKPDLVLSFRVTKEKAKARYLARARDTNDSEEKFERRFTEYEKESPAVEKEYRDSGKLIEIDVNGSKEDNINALTKALEASVLWQNTVVEKLRASSYFVVN